MAGDKVFKLPLQLVATSWDWDRHLIVDHANCLVAEVPINPDASDDSLEDDTKEMAGVAFSLSKMTNVFGDLVAVLEPFLYLGFSEEELRKRVDPATYRDIVNARRVHRIATGGYHK